MHWQIPFPAPTSHDGLASPHSQLHPSCPILHREQPNAAKQATVIFFYPSLLLLELCPRYFLLLSPSSHLDDWSAPPTQDHGPRLRAPLPPVELPTVPSRSSQVAGPSLVPTCPAPSRSPSRARQRSRSVIDLHATTACWAPSPRTAGARGLALSRPTY